MTLLIAKRRIEPAVTVFVISSQNYEVSWKKVTTNMLQACLKRSFTSGEGGGGVADPNLSARKLADENNTCPPGD